MSDELSQWWAEDVGRINDMAEAARQGKLAIEVGAAGQEFNEDGSLKAEEKPAPEKKSTRGGKLPPSPFRNKFLLPMPGEGLKSLRMRIKAKVGEGQPCSVKPGWNPKTTGCVPASGEGEGGKKPEAGKPETGQAILDLEREVEGGPKIHAPGVSILYTGWSKEADVREAGFHPEEVAALAGAIPGSLMKITEVRDGKVYVSIQHDKYSCRREISTSIIKNVVLLVWEPGQGLGLSIFSQQVDSAVKMGFSKIQTSPTRGRNYNGYYTWPRLGYDADISQGTFIFNEKVMKEAQLKGYKKVSDFFKTEEGRQFWKDNGDGGFPAIFDLTEGSQSRRVLDAYRSEKERARN